MNTILFTVATLTFTGLCAALILYFTSRKFFVEEDSRIDGVQEMLPGANCGGCGAAGCRAVAEQLVGADTMDGLRCPVGGDEVMKKVAGILGFEAQAKAPMVAVVRCNGSCENRPLTNVYDGAQSCKGKAALYAGDTGCPFGSLLVLTRADGSRFSLCPAEDSCGVAFADGHYYRYAADNDAFQRMFDAVSD